MKTKPSPKGKQTSNPNKSLATVPRPKRPFKAGGEMAKTV